MKRDPSTGCCLRLECEFQSFFFGFLERHFGMRRDNLCMCSVVMDCCDDEKVCIWIVLQCANIFQVSYLSRLDFVGQDK